MRTRVVLSRRNRGSFMLSFAALTVVLATLCATALMRSMETYQTSALAVERMQARAAAEGAAVAWSHGGLAEGAMLQLGDCTAKIDSATSGTAQIDSATSGTAGMDVMLSVEVRPKGTKTAVLKSRYVASAEASAGGLQRIRSLELVR